MNSKSLAVTLVAGSVFFAGSALASEIYKYTDENGNVVYIDRPTSLPDGEHVAVSSRPTDNAAVQANSQARLEASREHFAAKAEEHEEEELTRQEKREADKARKQQCEQDRAQLVSIEGRRRLYRQGEDGEAVYLTDDESEVARENLRTRIQENCG